MDQKVISALAGVAGAFVSWAFGGWSGLLELFLFALVLDYSTGVAASLKEGNGLDSNTGLWGLLKKVLMIVAVIFAHRADLAFEVDYIMIGTITAFLVNELISLAENYARLGLPLAKHLEPILSILKKGKVGGGTDDRT